MISKKIVLWVSIVLTLIFVAFMFFKTGDQCYSSASCIYFLDFRSLIGASFVIFPIVLLFSLITYKMRDEVYRHWMRFAQWYILAFVVVTYLISGQKHGGDFSGVMGGWFDAFILFLLLIIFFIISLVKIIRKYSELKNQKSFVK